jgi:autonomous glycyl radical cofactor GrcA
LTSLLRFEMLTKCGGTIYNASRRKGEALLVVAAGKFCEDRIVSVNLTLTMAARLPVSPAREK